MKDKYLVIDKNILPEVYLKVVKAKDLLKAGQAKGISDAVKQVGISRSAYYKYHQYVFEFTSDERTRKVTISFIVANEKGVLSSVLNTLANHNANVLTIHQGVPINELASVNITFDITNIDATLDELIAEVKGCNGVSKVEILAMGF